MCVCVCVCVCVNRGSYTGIYMYIYIHVQCTYTTHVYNLEREHNVYLKSFIQEALTQATELRALEDMATSFFFKEEERAKEEFKRALACAENSGKMYDEVRYPLMNTSKFYHMLYRLVSDKNGGKCQK